jgi:hypothetical protein
MHAPSPHPALLRSATLSIQGRVKRERSRGAPAPEFCSKKHGSPARSPSDGRRRWYRLHLDRARLKKSGRRNADRRVNLPSASADAAARPDLFPLPGVRGGQGGARSPVGVPPRRLRQRTNAAAQLQHALPGTRLLQALAASRLSQSSELLADRSWCRPGVFPEPPGDGSDEPPSAGTALAPAASVTRLPSCKLSETRGIRIRNGDLCQ